MVNPPTIKTNSRLSWDPASSLIEAAKSLDDYASHLLKDALASSDSQLFPLRDPLGLNLGVHRWLSKDREESYSDWLAWILQGASRAAEILPLFSIADDNTFGEADKVEREVSNDDGRNDIEISFGNRGLLLIEVKVRPTTSDLPSQLRRYERWAEARPVAKKVLALLGAEQPAEDVGSFVFTDWRTLCQRLRRYAKGLSGGDPLRASAILIFCGAVESNILGLSTQPRYHRASPTLDYLREWSLTE